MIQEKNETKTENLVQLHSKIFIADPCFTEKDCNKWYTATLDRVLTGDYEPLVNLEKESERVSSIVLVHKEYLSNWKEQKQELVSNQIDVESGQCGIYNYDYFMQQERFEDEYDTPSSFYSKACTLTCGANKCGIIDNNGFVTSSGWGDGLYDLYTYSERNGYIIAVELVFIYTNEGEDEE